MNDLVESPFAGRAVTETAGARQDQSRELADLQVVYTMAKRFPRDEVAAMDAILLAFTRPLLAEQSQYEYSRGGNEIRGATIKALQQIAVCWGNVDSAWRERSRGVDGRGVPYSEMEAVAVDLQTRTRKRIAWIVPHWRDTRQGGYVLKDERDIYELCANQAQRRVRACLEAVVPSDVVESAMLQADATLVAKADTTPENIVKIVETFAQFGVTKAHIEKRIQRKVESISPVQVLTLKRIYASLRDEMSEPGEWFDMGEPSTDEAGDDAPEIEGTGTAAVKSRMKKKTAGKAPKPTPKPKADVKTDEQADAKTEGAGSAAAAPAKGAPKAAASDAPLTFAQVAAMLNDAPDVPALDEASLLIRRVADPKQRIELEQLFSARMGEFDDEQA